MKSSSARPGGHSPRQLRSFAAAMCATAILMIAPTIARAAEPGAFETEYARLVISADGGIRSFADRRNGADLCARDPAPALARVRKAGREYPPTSAERAADRITLAFGEAGVTAVVRIEARPQYFAIEVLSVSDDKIDELAFPDLTLTLRGSPDEPFGACVLALNLKTNVRELPGFNRRLRAACYPRFGLAGARAALVAAPAGRFRPALQQAVSEAPDLPHSPLGGPWALDAAINQGSYLFNFGDLSEQTADAWIRLARTLGMNQIDFHGGSSFRFGDIRPNPKTYPNGRASLKAVIDRLHAAGIQAGLHTYAFFLAKDSEWVSPRPDPRLAKDATFTLDADLSADAATVPVVETTEKMSTITGFFEWNSVTVQIDDELITYAGVSKSPPYAFTQCRRGAWGTKAAPHARGAKVHHLKECFGLFVPDGDSTLLEEVAARTAEVFNECGFDMMYLDALDGEGILGGPEAGWHYGSKFVFAIWRHLKRPALMEMSTFHHHLWYVRSRYCAWDHPNRAHKKFIDIHVAANDDNRRIFMPGHLGWWAVKTWAGSDVEPTYADDIEYLCCKCLGTDTGFSVMGVDPSTIDKVPAFQRLAPIMRRYEEIRHARSVPDPVKARLRQAGAEYTLVRKPDGGAAFRPMHYARHKVEGIDGWSNRWTVVNPFGRQPVQVRIEALVGVGPYDAEGNPVLAAFDDAKEFAARSAAPGMTGSLGPTTTPVKVGGTSGELVATNTREASAPHGPKAPTWTCHAKAFSPPLDLHAHPALGLWVHGDGEGEVLNVQLKSPTHVSHGLRDHYIVVDFTGWRYFEMLEPESDRCDRWAWPHGGNAYAVYREVPDTRSIDTLSVWCNNVPPGKSVRCALSPIRALPAFDTKVINPSISVAGRTITFPVTIETGSYLELRSPGECRLYGRQGERLTDVKPQGEAPDLSPGENTIEFRAIAPGTLSVRARVTVITQGDGLLE